MSIFINKELRDLIPPLSEEEYRQLEENVVAEDIVADLEAHAI